MIEILPPFFNQKLNSISYSQTAASQHLLQISHSPSPFNITQIRNQKISSLFKIPPDINSTLLKLHFISNNDWNQEYKVSMIMGYLYLKVMIIISWYDLFYICNG